MSDTATIPKILKQQAATQPIIGEPSVPWFMQSLKKDKDEVTKKVDVPEKGEDTVLADGSTTDFWKYLKKFITTRQSLYRELLKIKVASSPFDMQEIGYRYVVSAQVDDVLQEIINRVENFASFANMDKETKSTDTENATE